MELTRVQVEKLKPLCTYDTHTVFLDDDRSCLGIYTALAIMIDTDAALRARVEELEQQLKESHESIQSAAHVVRDLTARLTTVERERDEWKQAAQMNNGIYESLHRQLAAVIAERDRLREERETQP